MKTYEIFFINSLKYSPLFIANLLKLEGLTETLKTYLYSPKFAEITELFNRRSSDDILFCEKTILYHNILHDLDEKLVVKEGHLYFSGVIKDSYLLSLLRTESEIIISDQIVLLKI